MNADRKKSTRHKGPGTRKTEAGRGLTRMNADPKKGTRHKGPGTRKAKTGRGSTRMNADRKKGTRDTGRGTRKTQNSLHFLLMNADRKNKNRKIRISVHQRSSAAKSFFFRSPRRDFMDRFPLLSTKSRSSLRTSGACCSAFLRMAKSSAWPTSSPSTAFLFAWARARPDLARARLTMPRI